jgi:hypothetical protein
LANESELARRRASEGALGRAPKSSLHNGPKREVTRNDAMGLVNLTSGKLATRSYGEALTEIRRVAGYCPIAIAGRSLLRSFETGAARFRF